MSDRGAKGGAALPAWVAIGAGIGVALGVAMDNIPLWLAIGARSAWRSVPWPRVLAVETAECR